MNRDLGKAMNMSGEKDRHMQDNTLTEKGKKSCTCSSSHSHNIKFMFSFNLEFERKHTFRGIFFSDWKIGGCFSITYSIVVSYIACDL